MFTSIVGVRCLILVFCMKESTFYYTCTTHHDCNHRSLVRPSTNALEFSRKSMRMTHNNAPMYTYAHPYMVDILHITIPTFHSTNLLIYNLYSPTHTHYSLNTPQLNPLQKEKRPMNTVICTYISRKNFIYDIATPLIHPMSGHHIELSAMWWTSALFNLITMVGGPMYVYNIYIYFITISKCFWYEIINTTKTDVYLSNWC